MQAKSKVTRNSSQVPIAGALGLLLAMVSGIASAGGDSTQPPACYRFDEKFADDRGLDVNRKPVCTAILAELNSQCDAAPHYCGLPRVSGETGISIPKWRPIVASDARGQYERLVRGNWRARLPRSSPEETEARWQSMSKLWDQAAKTGVLVFQRASVTYSAGQQEAIVYRVASSACKATGEVPRKPGDMGPHRSFRPEHYLAEAERYANEQPIDLNANNLVPLAARKLYGLHEIFNYREQAFTFTVGGGTTTQLEVTSIEPSPSKPAETAAIQTCVLEYLPQESLK